MKVRPGELRAEQHHVLAAPELLAIDRREAESLSSKSAEGAAESLVVRRRHLPRGTKGGEMGRACQGR